MTLLFDLRGRPAAHFARSQCLRCSAVFCATFYHGKRPFTQRGAAAYFLHHRPPAEYLASPSFCSAARVGRGASSGADGFDFLFFDFMLDDIQPKRRADMAIRLADRGWRLMLEERVRAIASSYTLFATGQFACREGLMLYLMPFLYAGAFTARRRLAMSALLMPRFDFASACEAMRVVPFCLVRQNFASAAENFLDTAHTTG